VPILCPPYRGLFDPELAVLLRPNNLKGFGEEGEGDGVVVDDFRG
jgi:hypothetical protein